MIELVKAARIMERGLTNPKSPNLRYKDSWKWSKGAVKDMFNMICLKTLIYAPLNLLSPRDVIALPTEP